MGDTLVYIGIYVYMYMAVAAAAAADLHQRLVSSCFGLYMVDT